MTFVNETPVRQQTLHLLITVMISINTHTHKDRQRSITAGQTSNKIITSDNCV